MVRTEEFEQFILCSGLGSERRRSDRISPIAAIADNRFRKRKSPAIGRGFYLVINFMNYGRGAAAGVGVGVGVAGGFGISAGLKRGSISSRIASV